MTHHYTEIFSRGKFVYERGYRGGKRFQNKVEYKPYLFVPSKTGSYRTIFGEATARIDFSDIYEAKDFIKQYKDVSNFNIHGLTNFAYCYINDEYPEEISYDLKHIKVGTLDIEVSIKDGYPNIDEADKMITAITICLHGNSYVYGYKDFIPTDHANTFYFQFKTEEELLLAFIKSWRRMGLDIITGWNTQLFDIPYLINRIRRIFGNEAVEKLSPWGFVYETTERFKGKEYNTYKIAGIASLDYMKLYRKFVSTPRESYSLNFICYAELGEKKLDYSEYGDLEGLYENNHQLYMEYNIRDVLLVDKLEAKLSLIKLAVYLTYLYKCNIEDVFGTVRPWDTYIHSYLLRKNIVVPPRKIIDEVESDDDSDRDLAGCVGGPGAVG